VEPVRGPLRAIARVALAAQFITGGTSALLEPPGRRAEQTARLGLPQPEALVRVNGATMVVAGTALALGLWPRAAAAALAGALVPTTLAGHRFWEEQDPSARRHQRIHFYKNLSMLGGVLLVLAERPRR
jgi:putative oxidoreductase